MNINPAVIPAEARHRAQDFGKEKGLTPQEAALYLMAHLFGLGYPLDSNIPTAVSVWSKERKIFPNKPEVQDALRLLHLDHLV